MDQKRKAEERIDTLLHMKSAVAGWATAESPAAVCGAGLNRMTSLHSRSS